MRLAAAQEPITIAEGGCQCRRQIDPEPGMAGQGKFNSANDLYPNFKPLLYRYASSIL
jgi:hypothetical protein